jgi:hypothetical protein
MVNVTHPTLPTLAKVNPKIFQIMSRDEFMPSDSSLDVGTCCIARQLLRKLYPEYMIDASYSKAMRYRIKQMARDWVNFSGDDDYPVTCPAGEAHKILEFMKDDTEFLGNVHEYIYEQSANVWIGRYGELRREYAHFVHLGLREYING